jgi:hypothetical protein
MNKTKKISQNPLFAETDQLTSVSGIAASMGGPKRQKSSIEFTLSRRAMEVWLIIVGMVGTGGFVTPWVPVATTPAG